MKNQKLKKIKKNTIDFFSIFIIVILINLVSSYYLEKKFYIYLYKAIFSSIIIFLGYLIYGRKKSDAFLYSIFGVFSKYLKSKRRWILNLMDISYEK